MARPLPPRKTPRKRGTTNRKAPSSQRVANQPSGEGEHLLAFDDRIVPLVFQSNKRARRIIIRLDHFHARVVVVLPSRATRDQGRRFALLNKGWISDRLAALPRAVPLRNGALVPYLGIPHRIRHRPGERGTVWREEGEIHVAGRPEHSKRRIEEWLKREARREIERRVRAKAELIGKPISRITLRDPKSRWGSCSPRGALSFSWRLILAPRRVLDYVVAHEVAHLKEMNHGPRFWKLTAELTRANVEEARAWLHHEGPGLHRFG
jgi:predicted metal-dependent hydrolase